MRIGVVYALGLAFALSSCGYHSLHGGEARERFRVELGNVAVADAIAADEAVAGAREVLSREGALGSGGDPRLVIDVTRIDESAEAISAPAKAPLARSVVVAVTGRGSVVDARHPDGPIRDTGDMRATALVRTPDDARGDAFVHDSAVRAAARRLGQKIAARAIGDPVSSEDGEGRAP
jgi:hypothetical protein